jgi:hypothetical protein
VDASAARSICQERARVLTTAAGAAVAGTQFGGGLPPLSAATLEGLKDFMLKKLIPGPSTANPIGFDYLGKIVFLKLAQSTRDFLVNEFNNTIMKMNALKAKGRGKVLAADQQDYNNLVSYANTIQKTGRQLRTTYDEIRNGLGAEGQGYPPSSSLNIPW